VLRAKIQARKFRSSRIREEKVSQDGRSPVLAPFCPFVAWFPYRILCKLPNMRGPVADRTSMQSIEIADGGLVLYDQDFLPKDLADHYFLELRETCAWEQKPGIFGNMQPRLISSYGNEGISYRYSGSEYAALPWTPTLLEIKKRIESVRGEFNYCLLNRYRNGADSMGWHADNEPEMGDLIGSLSLGAIRKFRIRHNTTRETMTFEPGNGTLIIMAGTMQQFWQHEVPKTKKQVGERINLTYRQINLA
jgi:2OG-Fe(II) oxygenase superfamily